MTSMSWDIAPLAGTAASEDEEAAPEAWRPRPTLPGLLPVRRVSKNLATQGV